MQVVKSGLFEKNGDTCFLKIFQEVYEYFESHVDCCTWSVRDGFVSAGNLQASRSTPQNH